ncbi:YNFM family putative membrane transporter [Sinorhizobium terangae]|uniref:MFS transporter n=1 Tax=Sinorhizobium terangae TaxID=110322 RepID=A0A6N7LF44_SINTE|nr:MFS transporter [Sinorhizobium terangae]MBB4184554.1 YNFM family putative membrane transporter [Sinorhizobium terangae]MQX16427.1 MFS transporter [Sinorhizobium terangae]
MENDDLIQIGTVEYQRLATAMVMAGFSTFSLLYSVQPLLPEFSSTFGISPENSSLAVSLATGPMAIGILAAGWLSDRIGRRTLMIYSLISAALFGTLAAVAPTWESLLVLRCLSGIALAGVPAVAMTYIAEEVEPPAIGPAMGLYIAGSAFGGMIGRLGAAVATEWLGWRWAIASIGLFSAAAAIVFCASAPASRAFQPQRLSLRGFLGGYAYVLRDRVLLMLYGTGFLMMGAFVTIYNYVPYRLAVEPYGLGHAEIGAIFLLYMLGSASSAWFGKLAGRIGVRPTFWRPVVVLLIGLLLTAPSPLWLIISAISVVTMGFFGAHTVASSWVSRRAFANRSHASALYLFGYYAGSSLLGSAGGVMWSNWGWEGVTAFTAGLCITVLAIAFIIARAPPLADPRQPKTGQRLPG